MIEYTYADSREELIQILELQEKNLPKSLSETEKIEQGFVTVHHNFDLLQKMNDMAPHIIAKSNHTVIGYALAMDKIFKDDIPLLIPMFNEIENTLYANSNYLVMGQVCIDKNYRGKGVFKGLYAKMKDVYSTSYDVLITEIDEKNTRSLNAHKAVGFKTFKTYLSNNQNWEVVYLEL